MIQVYPQIAQISQIKNYWWGERPREPKRKIKKPAVKRVLNLRKSAKSADEIFQRFLRFLACGRTNATISGMSPADFILDDFAHAMSAAPRLPTLSISGRLEPPAPEFNWRTRRDTRLTRTFGLPTFSLARLQSSAFIFIQTKSSRVA